MNISLFLLLLTLFPKSQPSVSLDEAIQLYGKGEYSQAANVLQQLRSSSPTEADVRLWLGKSYIKIRQWDNAVHEMEKAVQLQPPNALYHLWLGRAYGARAAHSFFATAIRWARRVVKEFETATRLAPKNLDARFDLLEFYLDAPGIVGGGKDKAAGEAQAISALDPQKGYIARSMIFQKNKKWDLARNELVQATIDYPQTADAHQNLAEYLLDRKDFQGALDYAQKALALNSASKQSQLIEAAARIQLHTDLDQAAEILQELAEGTLGEDDPAFEEVYYWLGKCYFAQGNKAKAREAFQTALAFNADYAGAKESISELR